MKVAVMQPYLFPYLGYFALMDRVDTFVLLDDAQFTRRGWIHRNQIPGPAGEPLKFTLPVEKCPQATPINQARLANGRWPETFHRTLMNRYGKAPYRKEAELCLAPLWAESGRLAPVVEETLRGTAAYLGITTHFRLSSSLRVTAASAAERVLALAKAVGGTQLHNLPGGEALYDAGWFAARHLPIHFVERDESWSVLHYLMEWPKERILSRIRGWGQGAASHTPYTRTGRNPPENESADSAPVG